MLFPIFRGLVILLWLAIIANLIIVLPEQLSLVLNITGVALLVAHLVEFVLFNKLISRLSDSTPVAFVKTMLFGLFYWKDPAAKSS